MSKGRSVILAILQQNSVSFACLCSLDASYHDLTVLELYGGVRDDASSCYPQSSLSNFLLLYSINAESVIIFALLLSVAEKIITLEWIVSAALLAELRASPISLAPRDPQPTHPC